MGSPAKGGEIKNMLEGGVLKNIFPFLVKKLENYVGGVQK